MSEEKQERRAVHEVGNGAVVLPRVQSVGGVYRESDPFALARADVGPGEDLYYFAVSLGEGKPLRYSDKDLANVQAARAALLDALERWHAPTWSAPLAGAVVRTDEPDLVAEFLACCCVHGEDVSVGSWDLYQAYRAWCEIKNIPEPWLSEIHFCHQVVARVSTSHRRIGSWWFRGLEVHPDWRPER